MPTYCYRCAICGRERELAHSIADCARPQYCRTPVNKAGCGPTTCGAELERLIPPAIGVSRDKRFRMHATLDDGSKVAGHFGKAAVERGFGKRD